MYTSYKNPGQGKSDEEKLKVVERAVKKQMKEEKRKRRVLKKLDLVVMDNSLRESTVAQLRGHTLENKKKIVDEVKKCNFKYIIVGSFSDMTRMEDVFVKDLVASGEDMTDKFAFSEGFDKVKDGMPVLDELPVGLRKCKAYGIPNVIFEIDLNYAHIDYENKFTIHDMCKLMKERILWCYENLSKDSKILINIRDIEDTGFDHLDRILILTQYVGSMDESVRPWGMVTEESGKNMPEDVGAWIKGMRMTMDMCNWPGQLFVHIHEKWGYCEFTTLECLANGANGIWSSVCQEGASMGHSCSSIALLNLIRYGNKKVLKRYNCKYLRQAAIKVTEITTDKKPFNRQPLYGGRAFDIVFGSQFAAAQDSDSEDDEDADAGDATQVFDLAEFFGVEPPCRITELSSDAMVQGRLINLFGESEHFTLEVAHEMKKTMLQDLVEKRKEEYMSPAGLAVLYDRSGGTMTPAMADVIAKMKVESAHGQELIDEIKQRWDQWDNTEEGEEKGDGMLNFRSFYSGFMANYFGCYTCKDTQRCLKAIDMDSDGDIDWNEFSLYLKWAVRQYPDTTDADDLLEIAFTRGIGPAMKDVLDKELKGVAEEQAKYALDEKAKVQSN